MNYRHAAFAALLCSLSLASYAQEMADLYSARGCNSKRDVERVVQLGMRCDNRVPGKIDNSATCQSSEKISREILEQSCKPELTGDYRVIKREGDYIQVRHEKALVWTYFPK